MMHPRASTSTRSITILAGVALALICAQPAAAADITSPGPLTRINITTDLNCQVTRSDDTAPEFFGGFPGACGTLVATGGTLFGPATIPAGGAASPRTPYTPVSQSAVTGTGTAANPFRVVTVVALGTTGLRVTETDTYVTGDESYRTDVQVSNTSTTAHTAIVYRAGDCFLQDSDRGFGRVDGSAISCVAAADPSNPSAGPGTRIEQFFPISPGSSYLHDNFSAVWAAIGARTPFPNQCNQCATFQDNGAGLSWSITVPAGGSVTRSSLITFSPLGRVPLTTTKTADSATSAPGANNGYDITITNPNNQAVTLTSITDTLPAGFSYRPGTTQEPNGQTDNPTISGQNLTFAGPYTVPANGSIVLQFGVTVSTTPGEYFNQAGGESADFTVAPTGPTARIVVVTGPTGRMVGKGSVSGTAGTASYAYILNCASASNANAPFEVRFSGQRFRLTQTSTVSCTNDPAVPGSGPFDTMTGSGTGSLTTGGPGSVQFTFVDGGAGGANDRVALTIRNAANAVVFQGTAAPPAKFPGSDQATGNNTAQGGGGV
jgi:uncharacterized repeat protein (TIGR01451 family)